MSSSIEQTSIVDGPSGNHVRIETDGRTIRPFLELTSALVDECKIKISEDHLSITAVDPANVGMVHTTIYSEAFDTHEIQGDAPFTVGVNLETFRSKLRDARLGKRTNDPVELDIAETRTRLEITREYDHTVIERTDEFLNIDPDSVRERPDMPDLDIPGQAELETDAFQDVIDACNTVGDHVRLTDDDGDLIIASSESNSGDIISGTRTRVRDAVTNTHDGEGSLFSLGYILDIASALKAAKVDDITIRYEEEFPARFVFEREADETTLYDGEFFVAPRIQDDGGVS